MRSTPAGHWRVTLAALFVAVVVFGFQQTAITPALPVVQRDLGTSREWATWLLSGYFIVASVTPVLLGKLADRSGKRRIFLFSLGAFLLGSIGAALSPSIGWVVACRLVQGLGGAVFPLAFAIARDEMPPARVSSGIGLLSGGFGVGALTGYGLGGLIAQTIGWRWIFWIGAMVLAAAAVLVRATVPASTARTRRALDIPGAMLFGVTLASAIVAVTEGPQRGWTSPLAIGMFAVAVVAAVAFVRRELHTPEPLMDLRILASRTLLLTNTASVLSGYSAVSTGVLLTFLVQSQTGSHLAAFGLTAGPLLTGLILAPRALGQAIGGPATSTFVQRFGQPIVFASGMGLMVIGLLGLALWRDSIWLIIAELTVIGAGFGVAISVMGSLATLAADPSETSVSAAINSVLRRVGGGVGAQIGVALLATITIGGSREPAPAAFTAAFLVGAVAALVGMVCAALIRRPAAAAAARE